MARSPPLQLGRFVRHGGTAAASSACPAGTGLTRCACQGCGSHVHALVLKQTISGLCSVCGGCDIAALKA